MPRLSGWDLNHMNSWPKQNYSSMNAFYGSIANKAQFVSDCITRIELPYQMYLAWSPEDTVKKISCNKKCAKSLYSIFEQTLKTYGADDVKKLKLDSFGGCLNIRKMRGGSAWSIHSWGAAVDLDPNRNLLRWGRDKAAFAKKEYEPFWKIVESEGWVSLGRAKNYDWMHFQAAKL